MSVVVVSGGFDPVHVGHCSLFEAAAQYGPLIVILNSDSWLIKKKGYRVMNWEDRAAILRAMKYVTEVVPVDDKDKTICEALRRIKPTYFAKSGDRTPESMPEVELGTCKELGIEILYNVCPHLPYSSSQIVAHRRNNEGAVWRPWGHYEVFEHQAYPEPPQWKLKRLDIGPGQSISLQRHEEREEHWIVVRGKADVYVGRPDEAQPSGEMFLLCLVRCETGGYVHVPRTAWHQIVNPDKSLPLTLVEVQMGRTCEEGDIERAGEKPKEKTANDESMVHLTGDLQDP